jgi:hypothetical protein
MDGEIIPTQAQRLVQVCYMGYPGYGLCHMAPRVDDMLVDVELAGKRARRLTSETKN